VPHDFSFEIEHRYAEHDLGITVPVTLRSGEDSFDLSAKVDTGSAFCIFRRDFGEILGINIESGLRQDIRTAAGSFVAYGHTLSFSVLGYDFDGVVYFASDYNFRHDVLGRQSLLEQIKLCIVDYERKLYLSRYEQVES
jgi:hypothetical protein